MTYPLHLNLSEKNVVVVGAGQVALRRIAGLLEVGAIVTVIAPEVHEEVQSLADAGDVTIIARPYQSGDLAGAWLVHIATNDPDTNVLIARDAGRERVWAVRADMAQSSDAVTPATGRIGEVTVSVSSSDPVRSLRYRNHIIHEISEGVLHHRPQRSRLAGSVTLVSAGPGDPELITVRGYRALRDADVVVYDRLAPQSLLENLDPEVELIDASKSPGNHVLTQEEINDVLVTKAQQGLRVVRLKGGDAFVFGRGSEEINACITAHIPVEVIPGVTSATAAPAAVNIPVTHRGLSAGFIVISGHEINDLQNIVASGLTTVVLMGVATLPTLVEQFLLHGADSHLPIAIVENAYSENQRTLKSTLESICSEASALGISNPAVIVIGAVVGAVVSPAEVINAIGSPSHLHVGARS